MLQPLEKCYLTQGYKTNHRAFDIGWTSVIGTDTPYLLAIDDGVVILSGFFAGTGAGYQVAIDIPSGNPDFKYMAVYAHNKQNLVKVGDKVKRGQRLAIGGSTGNSTGPHVHFELWKVPRNYKFTGYYFAADRNKYAIPPSDLINFDTINPRNLYKVEKYTETPLVDTVAKTEYTALNMRDYPSTSAFSVGHMPKELKAVAKTSRVRGHEWIKCEYQGRHVYVASQYVTLEKVGCEPIIKEIIKEVEVIKEVEKPFKETFERNGLKVTIEKIVK